MKRLSLLLPLVFLACDRTATNVTSTNQTTVPVAARFLASSVPTVDTVEARLSSTSSAEAVTRAAYSKGGLLNLGSVPVGDSFQVKVSGFQNSAGVRVVRWWGSGKDRASAGTMAQPVGVATDTATAIPALAPSGIGVGSNLALGAGVWYTTDNTDPRTSSTAKQATGSVTALAAGTIKAAKKALASDSATVLWSEVSSWSFLDTVARPKFSKDAGTFGSAQSVNITSATAGAVLHCTTNGDTPSEASGLCPSTLVVSTTETVQAIATKNGMAPSVVSSALYTIAGSVAPPQFSLAAGPYTGPQKVKISDSTAGATIYYTVDGKDPTTASSVYSDSLTIASSQTVKAIAVKNGTASSVASAAYVINAEATVSAPTFSLTAGPYTGTQKVKISDSTAGATIYYTVDGKDPTTSSSVYSDSLTIATSQTVKAIAVKNGTASSVASAAYVINAASTIPWNTTTAVYGANLTDSRDGKTYKTVVIGTQTWMAENLNYAGTSTTVGICYNNSSDSCAKYGRLYTWAEVMNGSVSSVTNPSGVKGVCPTGWHVPSDAEWQSLEVTAGMSAAAAATTDWRGTIEGTKLKSTSGWNRSGNGTDYYGFRILPAGYSDGSPYGTISGYAGFWSASESNTSDAWRRLFDSVYPTVERSYIGKTSGLTIRCVQDLATVSAPTFSLTAGTYTGTQKVKISDSTAGATIYYTVDGKDPTTASLVYSDSLTITSSQTVKAIAVKNGTASSVASAAYVINAASTIPWNTTTAVYGANLTDSRDGKIYKTVVIGSQTWMAENLNYSKSGSIGVCYNAAASATTSGPEDTCTKYGRLYTWAEAMNGMVSSAAVPSGVQGICPIGWHLPSDAEWDTLSMAANGNAAAGSVLKSTSGWNGGGNGLDSKGFRALPSGVYRRSSFTDIGRFGIFYSSTKNGTMGAWYRSLIETGSEMYRYGDYSDLGFSVRCVMNPASANLASLELTELYPDVGSLTQALTSGVYAYSVNVPYGKTQVVLGTTLKSGTSVTYDGSASGTILLADSSHTVRVVVRNGNGDSLVYRVTVPPQQMPLLALTPDHGALSPTFVKSTITYVDSLLYGTRVIALATQADAQATVSYNGSLNDTISLEDIKTGGTRDVNIVVSRPGYATLTYKVTLVVRSAPDIPWNAKIAYGKLTDARDGQSYRTVAIGNQIWMAENLNYKVDSSSCYGDNLDMCIKYGRLYTWTAVMNLNDSCRTKSCASQISTARQGVCPLGWHVPSKLEYDSMFSGVSEGFTNSFRSILGWYSGNGTDKYGFRAVPGGVMGSYSNTEGSYGFWWYGTEYEAATSSARFLYTGNAGAFLGPEQGKFVRMSLRCVQDN